MWVRSILLVSLLFTHYAGIMSMHLFSFYLLRSRFCYGTTFVMLERLGDAIHAAGLCCSTL